MIIYQLHLIQKSGNLFALPVYGEKRNIWDALAKHLHFPTYKRFCEVQKVNPVKHKAQFKLVEVKP